MKNDIVFRKLFCPDVLSLEKHQLLTDKYFHKRMKINLLAKIKYEIFTIGTSKLYATFQ